MQAVAQAAKKAGWQVAPPTTPKPYFPVVLYREPADFAVSTLPPQPTTFAWPAFFQEHLGRHAQEEEIKKFAEIQRVPTDGLHALRGFTVG